MGATKCSECGRDFRRGEPQFRGRDGLLCIGCRAAKAKRPSPAQPGPSPPSPPSPVPPTRPAEVERSMLPPMPTCDDCRRTIGDLEARHDFDGHIVCTACAAALNREDHFSPTSLSSGPSPQQRPKDASFELQPARVITALAIVGVLVLIVMLLNECAAREALIHRLGG